MKKLLSILGSLTLIASTITSVVSCVDPDAETQPLKKLSLILKRSTVLIDLLDNSDQTIKNAIEKIVSNLFNDEAVSLEVDRVEHTVKVVVENSLNYENEIIELRFTLKQIPENPDNGQEPEVPEEPKNPGNGQEPEKTPIVKINGQQVVNNEVFKIIPWNDYLLTFENLDSSKINQNLTDFGFDFQKKDNKEYQLTLNKNVVEEIFENLNLKIGDFQLNFIVEAMLPRYVAMWESITQWEQNSKANPINFRIDGEMNYPTATQSWMSIEALKLWFLTGQASGRKDYSKFVLDLAQDIVFDNFDEYQGRTWGWTRDTFWNIAFHSNRYPNLGNYNYYFRNNYSMQSIGGFEYPGIFKQNLRFTLQDWIFELDFWKSTNPAAGQWMEIYLFQYSGKKLLEFYNSMYGNGMGAFHGSNLYETASYRQQGEIIRWSSDSYERMLEGNFISFDLHRFGVTMYQADPAGAYLESPMNREELWVNYPNKDLFTLKFFSTLRITPYKNSELLDLSEFWIYE